MGVVFLAEHVVLVPPAPARPAPRALRAGPAAAAAAARRETYALSPSRAEAPRAASHDYF